MGSRLDAVVCVARNAGAIQLAVRALRSFREDHRVIGPAFYVLGILVRLQQFCEEALTLNALVLCAAALRRCAHAGNVQGGACYCMMYLCVSDEAVADALSMGTMELAIAALRMHRSHIYASSNASELLKVLCFDESRAVKAKQLGTPALLQAALKAHLSNETVHKNAAAALAHIQRFVDAACARVDAKMAELIAGEEAAKGSKGGAAPKTAGKGNGKGGEGAAAGWIPPPAPQPPVGADGEPALTKAQIKRRNAKAAAAARKAAAASGAAGDKKEEEEEEEEEGSDASSSDSEPPRSRPPIDFTKDAEFRRRLPPITNSPLVISPELLAASDAILAAHAALYGPNSPTQPGAADAPSQGVCDAAGETDGASTNWQPLNLQSAAAPDPTVAETATSAAPHSAAAAPVCDAPPATVSTLGAPSRSSASLFLSAASPPPSAQYVAALVAEIEALRADNAALRARVAELEARSCT